MYRKILVPVDGYSLPESVMGHIKELARRFNIWEVDFISVIDLNKYNWVLGIQPRGPMSQMGIPAVYSEMVKSEEVRIVKAADYLSRLVSDMQKEGIEARSFVILGEESSIIANFAVKHSIGLIVMSADEHYRKLRSALSHGLNKLVNTIAMPIMVLIPAGQAG